MDPDWILETGPDSFPVAVGPFTIGFGVVHFLVGRSIRSPHSSHFSELCGCQHPNSFARTGPSTSEATRMSDNRDMGIEFGDLQEDLETENYPISKEELLEKYGDRTVEHSGGESTVEEVLGPLGREEFEGQDEVHQSILNMVGDDAEGRENYSDRGGSVAGENRDTEGGGEDGDGDGSQESL